MLMLMMMLMRMRMLMLMLKGGTRASGETGVEPRRVSTPVRELCVLGLV